jgi:SMODS-associating 2TM, beta-strand rich effector domain
MKNAKSEALLWVQLGTLVAVWAAILYVTNTPLAINWEAVKKLPDVVTVYVVILFVFTKWMWRWPIFRGWLVSVPDLQGTWAGKIISNWKEPGTGYSIPPVPVMLVIRQTFNTISCSMFTAESESYSSVAQFTRDEDNDTLFVNYNYSNRPKATIRDRSNIHDGAARLRVLSAEKRLLEGEFWTSRCTAGEIYVEFVSQNLLDKFPEPKKA